MGYDDDLTASESLTDDSRASLEALGLTDYLNVDPRPTFVIDLAADNHRPLYTNRALRARGAVLSAINGHAVTPFVNADYDSLNRWIRSGPEAGHTFKFATLTWTRTILKTRWRIMQGEVRPQLPRKPSNDPQDATDRHLEEDEKHAQEQIKLAQKAVAAVEPIARVVDRQTMPWIDPFRERLSRAAPDHLKLFYAFDWATTELGPIDEWPDQWRHYCQLVMCNPQPANVLLGPKRRIVYNVRYLDVLGQKHPAVFGLPFTDIYPEVTGFDRFFGQVEETKRGINCADCLYFIYRHGFLEETYFTFSLIPLFDEGRMTAIYNPVWETTGEVVSARRTTFITNFAEKIAAPRSLKSFWSTTVQGFTSNENDFPLISVYSGVISDDDSVCSAIPAMRRFQLEGTSPNIPRAHRLSQPFVDLTASDGMFTEIVRRVVETGESTTLQKIDGSLPDSLLGDTLCPPFGDLCTTLVIYPVQPTSTSSNTQGFIIIGINPRLPYSNSFKRFVDLVMRHTGTGLASAILIEEEIRRAKMEQEELSRELERTALRADSADMQFEHFADSAPIGVNIMDLEGNVRYANKTWYETTQVRKGCAAMEWMSAFVLDETANIEEIWKRLTVDKESVSFEARVRKPWCPPGELQGECSEFTWILACAYPDLLPDGSVIRIVGCFVDISQQKYIEQVQTRRMNDAIEAKRLQESFIDMTSHELRNPLSAVVHAADGIISLLSKDLESPVEPSELTFDAVASSLDAAKSIVHCSLHQKRIADDILTASKLDSNLLPVSPDTVQIVDVLQKAVRMFEGESKSASISMKIEVDNSLRTLEVDWVYVDPSRLTQIFVNLVANAIKFTQTEERKQITIRLGASYERQHSAFAVRYVKSLEPKKPRQETNGHSNEGKGRPIFLHFAVDDTGRGLTDAECDILFRRFSQASPRTHVTYGGSGLGLFISRELTELQGGEIGVASTPGHGSTFSFYIKAFKAEPPSRKKLDRVGSHSKSSSTSQSSIPILVQSMPPDGHLPTKVNLSTPTERVNDRPSAIRKASAEKTHPRSSAATKASLRDRALSLLYVEDNLVNRKVLSKQLRNQGFEVHEANHGAEALEFLRSTTLWSDDDKTSQAIIQQMMFDGDAIEPPPRSFMNDSLARITSSTRPATARSESKPLHLILMDLEMPVMDGLTCMKIIRKLQKSGSIKSHILTIAVTANARREQIQTALDAGMDDVVSKPFRLPELVSRIEEMVEDGKNVGLERGKAGSPSMEEPVRNGLVGV